MFDSRSVYTDNLTNGAGGLTINVLGVNDGTSEFHACGCRCLGTIIVFTTKEVFGPRCTVNGNEQPRTTGVTNRVS